MRRLIPLLLVLTAAIAVWASGLDDELTWAGLARHQHALLAWVAGHKLLAAGGYVLTYIAAATLSLPAGSVLTAAGGLLFGAVAGAALAVCGATAGATMLFVVARSALGDGLARRGGARVQAVLDRLRRDGFRYLLAIRLVPLFPFWLTNLAAALCGMRLAPYVAATALGILPATCILAWIGAGVADVLAAGGRPDLSVLLSLPVLGPLLALAALSLLPLLWRRGPAGA